MVNKRRAVTPRAPRKLKLPRLERYNKSDVVRKLKFEKPVKRSKLEISGASDFMDVDFDGDGVADGYVKFVRYSRGKSVQRAQKLFSRFKRSRYVF